MTDFYQWMFGRPSPGKRQRREFLRYANNGENREEVERAGSLVGGFNAEPPMPPEWAQGERGRFERARPEGPAYPVGPGGLTERVVEEPVRQALRVPLSQMTGVDRSGRVLQRPYGEDFPSWEAETRSSNLPSYLRNEGEVAAGDEVANPGREPRNPGNVIADAPRGERREVWHGSEFWGEWHRAENSARERWQGGRPNPLDMLFAAIYGKRDRLDELQEETEDMRQRAREVGD